jgi:hypothetical protein
MRVLTFAPRTSAHRRRYLRPRFAGGGALAFAWRGWLRFQRLKHFGGVFWRLQ